MAIILGEENPGCSLFTFTSTSLSLNIFSMNIQIQETKIPFQVLTYGHPPTGSIILHLLKVRVGAYFGLSSYSSWPSHLFPVSSTTSTMSSLSQSTRNSSWNLPKASSGQQQLSVTDRYNIRKISQFFQRLKQTTMVIVKLCSGAFSKCSLNNTWAKNNSYCGYFFTNEHKCIWPIKNF